MAEETILIDVVIDDATAANKLQNLSSLFAANTKQIDANKAAMKDLNRQLKEGTVSEEEYGKQMVLLKASTKELTAQNNELVKTGQAIVASSEEQTNALINEGGSIASMRREVTLLQQQYSQLTKAERESAAGKEMLSKLQALETETRQAEVDMRNFKTTIGNYPTAIASLVPGFDKMQSMISSIGVDINTLASGGTKGLASVGTAAKAMGKAFITPPVVVIVAVIGSIVLVVQKLVEAFKKNDAAMTKLQAAMAAFKPILTLIGELFSKLAEGVATFVEYLVNAVTWLVKANPIFKAFAAIFPETAKGMEEQSAAARQLVIDQDKLQDTEREYTENKAKREAEVAKLRSEALDKDKYTAEERKKMLEDAMTLEQQNLEDNKAIIAERLRLFDEEAKANNDTSDEMKNKRAELVAALYKADEEYYTGTKRLKSQYLEAVKEIDNEEKKQEEERKKRAEAWAQTMKERKERAANYAREVEEAIVAAMAESIDKQIKLAQLQTKYEIEELKKRLKTEKGLTEKEKNDIATLIRLKEEDLQKYISGLQEEDARKRVERAVAAETEAWNLRLAASKKDTEEYYSLRRASLERLIQLELANTDLTEKEKLNIAEKYRQLQAQVDEEQTKAAYQREMQRISDEYEARLLNVETNDRLLADMELRIEQQKLQRLEEMDAETKARMFETEQQYDNAIVEQKNKIYFAQQNLIKMEAEYAKQQVSYAASILDDMESIFEDIGADTQAFAIFNKMIALANASISLGEAIAAATAAATAGDPYTLALRVAAAVSSVIAAFSSVITSIKKASIPEAPKFAAGGVVGGTNYQGDRVVAKVNSGEMILTREQQTRLFELANGGGIAGNIETLSMAMADAVAALPAPTLVYTEFEEFTQNVTRIREYENL